MTETVPKEHLELRLSKGDRPQFRLAVSLLSLGETQVSILLVFCAKVCFAAVVDQN
jgi:hypothetical protein